ncbi:MAG: DUF4115 domain-containing protein [Gammaproteobacteria bacterium]|nr:DUF4115 domain-containing protein [Gammaproteobacteria bacterium]
MTETVQDNEESQQELSDDRRSDWSSPGEKLKKLREERGLSHHRVAEALHMTAHYVKSLESDQYQKLPGKTFVKGYFKAYARLLDADVDEVMQCYEQYVSALEETQENEAEEIRAKKVYDQNIRWMICAAVIILLVISISWWMSREDGEEVTTLDNTTQPMAQAEQVTEPVTENQEIEGTVTVGREEAVFAMESAQPVTAGVLIANLEEKEMKPTSSAVDAESNPDQEITEALVREEGTTQTLEAVVEEVAAVEELAPVAAEEPQYLAGNAQELLVEPDDTVVTRFDDHKEVEVQGEGDDFLEIHFSGASWIEVDDRDNMRLYHNMFDNGDDLRIWGKAPFNVLIGDAVQVRVTFNSEQVDVLSRIRDDNSARILLEPEPRQ